MRLIYVLNVSRHVFGRPAAQSVAACCTVTVNARRAIPDLSQASTTARKSPTSLTQCTKCSSVGHRGL